MPSILPDQWSLLAKRHGCHHLRLIGGTDEVGRGPLAGPVVAAAVTVSPEFSMVGLRDSKTLSAVQRDELYARLTADAGLWYAVAIVSEQEIDRLNILQASLLAMRLACEQLNRAPELLFVDGNRTVPGLPLRQQAVIKGDAIIPAVSAASIIAKVTRDRIMARAEEQYPAFSFARHVGYPTPAHLQELQTHGPTPIHRRSFRPVAELLALTEAIS